MESKVLELVKDLGYTLVSTAPVYPNEIARIHAENGSLSILASVMRDGLGVSISSGAYSIDDATLLFLEGEAPDLRFRKYTPELLRLARYFAEAAGFDIW